MKQIFIEVLVNKSVLWPDQTKGSQAVIKSILSISAALSNLVVSTFTYCCVYIY